MYLIASDEKKPSSHLSPENSMLDNWGLDVDGEDDDQWLVGYSHEHDWSH
jgi:hypothetical protein